MTGAALPRPDRWRPAWLLTGGVLAVVWALVAFAWWIRSADGLDRTAVDAVGAAIALDYFGAQFTTDAVLFTGVAVVAGIILSTDRTNRIGWLLMITWSIGPPVMTMTSAAMVASAGGLWPVGWAAGWAVGFAAAQLVIFVTLPTAIALFPTGRFPSAKWRRAFQLVWVTFAIVGLMVLFRGGNVWSSDADLQLANPIGIDALDWVGNELVASLMAVYGLMCVAVVAARFRSADTVQRLQLKWFLTAVVVLFLSMVVGWLSWAGWASGYLMTAGAFTVVGAIGVAITRYRLYDIDLVINRALVFGGLAAFVTVIYAVIVVGVGSIIAESSLALSVTATAVVAVVFEPVRTRVQKLANRLVYGSRATPYEVLSDLTSRLSAIESGEGLLERMAERLAEGTGAERAVVWTAGADGLDAAAAVPTDAIPPTHVDFTELPGLSVAVEHEGETLGALTVEKARGDALTPTEVRLVEDLAGSAGLVMRRRLLDAALTERAGELRASRQRLVGAQDLERRRLERDLHDSAQQQVVALKVKLGLTRQVAEREEAGPAIGFIEQMELDAQGAIDQIRSLAQGIYPPLLESNGLAAAIPALASLSPLEVATEISLDSRHALPTEGAIYFCIAEALTNAAKHAQGPILVRVADTAGGLTFSVTDSGPGFDPTTVERGAGLNNMRDRLDVLGGAVAIESEPGGVTTVSGTIPVGITVG